MSEFEIVAEPRTKLGKSENRRLRRANKVPAVIYGAGKKPQALTLDHEAIKKNLAQEAFYSHVLTVKIGSTKEKAVLKDLQRHPWRPIIMHLDLQRVSETEKLRMHVPLHFVDADKSPAIKVSKAIVNHLMTNVEISCKAVDLPEYLEVDLSKLQEGDTVHLADVSLPQGVELITPKEQAIAAVHVPRGVVEEDEAGAAPAADAEAGGDEEPKPSGDDS